MMWRKTSDFCVKWVYVCTVQAAEGVEYPAVVSLSLSLSLSAVVLCNCVAALVGH